MIAMLAPVLSVLGIALQRRQHLLMAVGEPHSLYGQVLAILIGQEIRHTHRRVSVPSSATVAAQSWHPAVSSLLPSTKNSLLRASRQSLSHSSRLT